MGLSGAVSAPAALVSGVVARVASSAEIPCKAKVDRGAKGTPVAGPSRCAYSYSCSDRRLRGTRFIDPEDQEFKVIIKNSRKKLGIPAAPAMPCKRTNSSKHGATRSGKVAFWKQMNPSDFVWKELYLKLMKTTLQEKEVMHCIITILVYKFIPTPQAMKMSAAKPAVDKEWRKLKNISAWNLAKVRNKSDMIDEARNKHVKVHCASLMDICHLKNAELEKKHQEYKGRVVLLGDIVKDDSGSYAVFTEQGSSASQMTAAKVMDII